MIHRKGGSGLQGFLVQEVVSLRKLCLVIESESPVGKIMMHFSLF